MLTIDGEVDDRGLRAVEQLLGDEVCCSAAYRAETASTNSWALSDLRGGRSSACPQLYLADHQTGGRGRHGRSWISSNGTLTFSLVVDWAGQSKSRTSRLASLAVGVAIARCLEFEFAPLQTKLKWPNDVYVDGGKVAGVLLEATPAAQRLVIGIGVNVGKAPELDRQSDPQPASGISSLVGRPIHRYDVLPSMVANVVGAIAQLDHFAEDLILDFQNRCLLTGKVISFQSGQVRREGVCRGITDQGALIVESGGQQCELESGDARLVRVTQ